MWEKKKLEKLKYIVSFGMEMINSKEVLEGLEPHSNLKSLTIRNYTGECSPSWLTRKRSVSASSASFQPINLVELNLWHCDNLKELPCLGFCPKLKFLKIEGLKKVRCIGKEFYINGDSDSSSSGDHKMTLFPALEIFTLSSMEELREWVEDVEPTIHVFPSLKELTIESCYNLSSVPVMSRFSSLEILKIRDCNELSLIGDALFPSTLKELRIGGCKKLRCIQSIEGGISFLQKLDVTFCEELNKIEEGLVASTCLRDVYIFHCPKLISIPINPTASQSLSSLSLFYCEGLTSLPSGLGTYTSLVDLRLGPFSEELEEFPFLTSIPSSLEYLALHGWGKISSLPLQLQHLTALEELEIINFNGVKAIPTEGFGKLLNLKRLELGPFSEELEEFPFLTSIPSSLRYLTLYGWEKLSDLPHQLQHLIALVELVIHNFSGVKALPEWLGNLSSLRRLEIQNCGNLEHLPSKEAMLRLSNLKDLSILDCPRFQENRAEELPKISHIRDAYII